MKRRSNSYNYSRIGKNRRQGDWLPGNTSHSNHAFSARHGQLPEQHKSNWRFWKAENASRQLISHKGSTWNRSRKTKDRSRRRYAADHPESAEGQPSGSWTETAAEKGMVCRPERARSQPARRRAFSRSRLVYPHINQGGSPCAYKDGKSPYLSPKG